MGGPQQRTTPVGGPGYPPPDAYPASRCERDLDPLQARLDG